MLLTAHGFHDSSEILSNRKYSNRLPHLLVLSGIIFAVACSNREYHRFFTRDHGDVETVLPEVIKSYEITNALVFYETYSVAHHKKGIFLDAMRRERGWSSGRMNDHYASGFRLNDLDLAGDVVFARHIPGRPGTEDPRENLIRDYPDRNCFLYRYDRGSLRARLSRLIVHDGRITATMPITPHPNCRYLMPTADTGQP